MHIPSTEEGVLACDLDGTLVRGNTFPRFVRFALVQLARQGDLLAVARLAWALVARKVLRRPHLRFKEDVHRAGLRLEEASIDRWVRALLTSHAHPDVERLVQGWPGLTVLCTAAPSCYAEALGNAAGFDVVLGSGWGSEQYVEQYVENVHEAKADRLRAAVPAPISWAVTDDVQLDGPLLAMSAHGLVVDRDGRLSAWPGPQGRSTARVTG